MKVLTFDDSTVSIFPGNGKGMFHAYTDYNAGPSPADVAYADYRDSLRARFDNVSTSL